MPQVIRHTPHVTGEIASLRLGRAGWWLAALGFAAAMGCPGGEAQELKVGYVNVAKVFDGYVKTQRLDASLETKGKQKEAELKGRMDELKKLRQSLELLNEAAREARAREIEEKTEELAQFRARTGRDLRRERDAMARGLLDEIRQGLVEFAKAGGFTLILDSQSLLYGQDAYDVTEEVLALLNGRAKASPGPRP